MRLKKGKKVNFYTGWFWFCPIILVKIDNAAPYIRPGNKLLYPLLWVVIVWDFMVKVIRKAEAYSTESTYKHTYTIKNQRFVGRGSLTGLVNGEK